ncbi:MAG: hypothetical protein D8M57_07515 [Candidatus Scalindua sp. AMX11]|nr:MAG: hypothetical protein DWQ00_05765 [Candidatus Scalindua sp.]NOG82506.1 hypothetical protein [Planctomycetota bacterium]RZV93938.1 MAG: hypothetical protein EX341_03530 [Candidatus Scalindua sp. SCAELEC01]TDE65557.1 MAG: hypothetical protein D8M57_07515 [Candidatus Scalindua sp. AMX11]GJQ58141.1 MAG: hypothetical protein SCALA701_09420 [Candidatus Scalindua sp.]
MNEQLNNCKRIETFLTEAKSPLTSQQICKGVFKSEGNRECCTQSIQILLDEEKIFPYPSLRKNSKERYWHIAPQQYVKNKIYHLFEKDCKDRTFKSVKSLFCKWELEFFDDALAQLFRERDIFEVKYGRTRYLKGIQKITTELSEWFNPVRVRKLTPSEWEAFLKEEKVPEIAAAPKKPKASLEDLPIRKWYQEDRHKRYGLETIPIKWTGCRYLTWCNENGYEADIEVFNNRLKILSKEGKVELTHHSTPDQIPEDERKYLFEIRHGTIAYYWRYVEES